MIADPPPYKIKTNKYYRCRPSLYESCVLGPYLLDLDGINLQVFFMKDYSLCKVFPVLEKEDQYSAKIFVLGKKTTVIFGTETIVLVDIEEGSILEKMKVGTYIEHVQVYQNYFVILSTDQDTEARVLKCWKYDEEKKKIEKIGQSSSFQAPEFEECSDQNLSIALVSCINKEIRVYVYWKRTRTLIEIDPKNQQTQQYTIKDYVNYINDLNEKAYLEVVRNNIYVHDKQKGNKIAELTNKGEQFLKAFGGNTPDQIITLSEVGIKKWKLESNTTPVLFAGSDKSKVEKLFFSEQETVIGINSKNKNIVTWKNPNECESSSFPTEAIMCMQKLNQKYVILLLEASVISCEDEDQQLVEKYHKLEIYDFEEDIEVAKKAMNQAKFSIDANSIVVCEGDTIRFFVKEEDEEGGEDKKYLFRWTPFQKDENQKDLKKKEIKGAKNFHSLKLYPYDRVIGVIKPKQQKQEYSVFGNSPDPIFTKIYIYDFSVKKVGQYDLPGAIKDVQISSGGMVYALYEDLVSVYQMDSNRKNQMEKVNELEIKARVARPIGRMLLFQKQQSFVLLNEEFDLLIKEEIEEESDGDFKILPYLNTPNFFLKTNNTLTFWNTQNEETVKVDLTVNSEPNLTEFMEHKIISADKWIKADDINLKL